MNNFGPHEVDFYSKIFVSPMFIFASRYIFREGQDGGSPHYYLTVRNYLTYFIEL